MLPNNPDKKQNLIIAWSMSFMASVLSIELQLVGA